MITSLYRCLLFGAGILLLLQYCVWRVQQQVAWKLPNAWVSQTISIQGQVQNVPKINHFSQRFLLKTTLVNHQKIQQTIQLSWYRSPIKVRLGQICYGEVRLKPLHPLLNPNQSMLSRWSTQLRYRARGYIYKQHWRCRSSVSLRQRVVKRISECHLSPEMAGLITALSVGSQSLIQTNMWQVLKRSGTSHLLAISGLHLGLVAMTSYLLLSWLWRRSASLCLLCPAPLLAAILTVVIITAYALLCGFAVPVKRAWIMAVCFIVASMFAWNWPALWRLGFAALLVFIIQPWDLLLPGFWLSFYVVLWLIISYPCFSDKPKWVLILIMQGIITLALLPLVVLFFHGVSLISYMANLVAIPWISFVVIPLCLVATLSALLQLSVAIPLFSLASQLLSPLWQLLCWLASKSYSYWVYWPVSVWQCFIFAVGIAMGIWPRRIGYWRVLAIPCTAAVFLFRPPVIPDGTVKGNLLDVGQGLALVLLTAHHALIYDTGPKYAGGFDAGLQVVVPYVRSQHRKVIDRIVISHGDNDHIGGLQSVLKAMPVVNIMTSVPRSKLNSSSTAVYQRCYQGQHWAWDGVDFDVLYPRKGQRYHRNNSSCVIRVTAGLHHLLLTGDIEKDAEKWLLKHERSRLRSDILQVPHHGSRTSSTLAWLTAVKPRYAINGSGFLNRYHFPQKIVLNRYHDRHIPFYDTAKLGAINFTITS